MHARILVCGGALDRGLREDGFLPVPDRAGSLKFTFALSVRRDRPFADGPRCLMLRGSIPQSGRLIRVNYLGLKAVWRGNS